MVTIDSRLNNLRVKRWLKLCSTMWGANHHSFFDGTCYDYWKRNMKMYLGSINDQVWDVTENDYAIIDPDNPTN